MAVYTEPNAEDLAKLIQVQGQRQGEPPASTEPTSSSSRTTISSATGRSSCPSLSWRGTVFFLRSLFIFRSSAVLLGVFFPCPGFSFCYFCYVFHSHGRVLSLYVYRVLWQVLLCTVFFTLCCRPAGIFCYRVFDLRKSLILCSTWEIIWSCVRPEREFGRVRPEK